MMVQDEFEGKLVKDMDMGYALIHEQMNNAPKVGDWAPEFSLSLMRGDGQIALKDYRGKSSVVLVFGSYT